jgi:hypothetical protein
MVLMMRTRQRAEPGEQRKPYTATPSRGSLQRKCGCGQRGSCIACSEKADDSFKRSPNASSRGVDKDPRFGHDFSKVRITSDQTSAAPAINDQTQSGGLDPKFMQTTEPAPASAEKDLSMGDEYKATSTTPVVDQVELVDSSTGAVGGYPAKLDTCDASLNNPGPFNDNFFLGSVANVHQVQFHVAQGYPGDLRATRIVNRTAEGRGQKLPPKSGNDGPPDHEYMYTKDKMVVADAPGWCSMPLKDTDFPITYKADFAMYAWDAPTKKILASISYHVEIEKTHYVQRDPVNTVSVTDKKVGGVVASPVKPKK